MNYPDPRWSRESNGSLGRPPDQFGQFHGFQLASWGWRAGAGIIDWGLFAIPYGTLSNLSEWLGGLIAFSVLFTNSGFLASQTGQSLGKRVFGVHMFWSIERRDGTYDLAFVPVWVALGRIPLHALDYFACFSGFFAPIWAKGRGTYADYLTRTVHFRDPRLLTTVRPIRAIYGRAEYPGERNRG